MTGPHQPQPAGRATAAAMVVASAVLLLIACATWDSGEAAASDELLETGQVYTTEEGMEVSVSVAKKLTALSGETFACGTVKLKNTTAQPLHHQGGRQWSISTPDGRRVAPSETEFTNSLVGGTIGAGGDASGIVCAEGSQTGSYVFEFAPAGHGTEAEWFARL